MQERERGRGDDLSSIVEVIKVVGPRNCSLISRLTGVPVETVRYKIRKQLMKKGVKVHVGVNYNKLGLERCWINLDFNSECGELAPEILLTLSKTGYLIYYGRVVPQGNYVTIIAIPASARAEYIEFLNGLIDLGILVSYKIDELAWVRHLSMRPEYYDFDTGTWNVDWKTLNQSKVIIRETTDYHISEPVVDKTDVLTLEALQFDSTTPIAKIAREIGMKSKKVMYHFKEHILKRGLITNYVVRWQNVEKDALRSILCVVVEFRGLMEEELRVIQEIFHKLPFTWFDALSTDQNLYLVYLTMPIPQYVDALDYLRRNLSKYDQKFKISLIDALCSKGYTLPCEMFDETLGWTFNAKKTLERFSSLVMLIKK